MNKMRRLGRVWLGGYGGLLVLCALISPLAPQLAAATLRYNGVVVLGKPDGQGGIVETVGGIIIRQDAEKGLTCIEQDCTAVYSSKVELWCNGIDIFLIERFANPKIKPLATVRRVGTRTLGEAIGTIVEIPYLVSCTKYREITNCAACEIPLSLLHKDPDFGCDAFTVKPGAREGEVIFWLNGTGRTKRDGYEYQLPPPYHNGYVAARLLIDESTGQVAGTLPKRVDFSFYRSKPGGVDANDLALHHRVSVVITNVEVTSETLVGAPVVRNDETYETVDYRFESLHGDPFFYRVGKGGDVPRFIESQSKEFGKIEDALKARLGMVPAHQPGFGRHIVLAVLVGFSAFFALILARKARKTGAP
ncbi:MAG: hypothetical protein RMN51_09100 [Verrucomicrobiota bacterium]|nr:hypothetical protein [Verrucomicrobiota bacterium]